MIKGTDSKRFEVLSLWRQVAFLVHGLAAQCVEMSVVDEAGLNTSSYQGEGSVSVLEVCSSILMVRAAALGRIGQCSEKELLQARAAILEVKLTSGKCRFKECDRTNSRLDKSHLSNRLEKWLRFREAPH